MKKLTGIIRHGDSHWVGDGFPVRTLFSYNTREINTSPFLLLDYAGPAEFPPESTPRGVGQHPHRGFETVTIVYAGVVEHADTAGNAGRIGPGDVQWMTAGRGVLHEEMHGQAFSETGGRLEMVQLWVNLPASDKMTAPAYQAITDQMIPVVVLDNDSGQLRVIAGEYLGTCGPAKTFTPINLWDIQLKSGSKVHLDFETGSNVIVLVLEGVVRINGQETLEDAQVAGFERDGSEILLDAEKHSRILLMNGEPIDEPVVGYGPFVMNSREEINQAIDDFNAGRFASTT